MIPDDTAGPPLTPGERAAIADLERRFLLDAPAPVRDRLVGARPVRFSGSRLGARPAPAVPLVALFVTTCLLVSLAVVSRVGLLGVAAVLLSVVGTALLWPLVPARFGGPVRPSRRAFRTRPALRDRR